MQNINRMPISQAYRILKHCPNESSLRYAKLYGKFLLLFSEDLIIIYKSFDFFLFLSMFGCGASEF